MWTEFYFELIYCKLSLIGSEFYLGQVTSEPVFSTLVFALNLHVTTPRVSARPSFISTEFYLDLALSRPIFISTEFYFKSVKDAINNNNNNNNNNKKTIKSDKALMLRIRG